MPLPMSLSLSSFLTLSPSPERYLSPFLPPFIVPSLTLFISPALFHSGSHSRCLSLSRSLSASTPLSMLLFWDPCWNSFNFRNSWRLVLLEGEFQIFSSKFSKSLALSFRKSFQNSGSPNQKSRFKARENMNFASAPRQKSGSALADKSGSARAPARFLHPWEWMQRRQLALQFFYFCPLLFLLILNVCKLVESTLK
jgi:hypothetical protein